MENASKALIMAGSILIGIIIVSTFVYIFNSSANFAHNYEETLGTVNIVKFNNEFEQYLGRTDITIYEIISLINYVKDYNEKNAPNIEDDEVPIDLKVNNVSYIKKSDSDLIDYIKNDSKKYTCEGIQYHPNTQLVAVIMFKTSASKNIG